LFINFRHIFCIFGGKRWIRWNINGKLKYFKYSIKANWNYPIKIFNKITMMCIISYVQVHI
jgi:hypothetical protein